MGSDTDGPRLHVRAVWAGEAKKGAEAPEDYPQIEGCYVPVREEQPVHENGKSSPVEKKEVEFAGPIDPRRGYSAEHPGPNRIFALPEPGKGYAFYVTDQPTKDPSVALLRSNVVTGDKGPWSEKKWKAVSYNAAKEASWTSVPKQPVSRMDAWFRVMLTSTALPSAQGVYELVDVVGDLPCWACMNYRLWSRTEARGQSRWVLSEWTVGDASSEGGQEQVLAWSEPHGKRNAYHMRFWEHSVDGQPPRTLSMAELSVRHLDTSTSVGAALVQVSHQLCDTQMSLRIRMHAHAPKALKVVCPVAVGYGGVFTLHTTTHNNLPVWKKDDMRIYAGREGHWQITGHHRNLTAEVAGIRNLGMQPGKYPHEATGAWATPNRERPGWVDCDAIAVMRDFGAADDAAGEDHVTELTSELRILREKVEAMTASISALREEKAAAVEERAAALATLQEQHAAELAAAREEHCKELAAMQEHGGKEVAAAQEAHQREISDAAATKQQWEGRVEQQAATINRLQADLAEQTRTVEQLLQEKEQAKTVIRALDEKAQNVAAVAAVAASQPVMVPSPSGQMVVADIGSLTGGAPAPSPTVLEGRKDKDKDKDKDKEKSGSLAKKWASKIKKAKRERESLPPTTIPPSPPPPPHLTAAGFPIAPPPPFGSAGGFVVVAEFQRQGEARMRSPMRAPPPLADNSLRSGRGKSLVDSVRECDRSPSRESSSHSMPTADDAQLWCASNLRAGIDPPRFAAAATLDLTTPGGTTIAARHAAILADHARLGDAASAPGDAEIAAPAGCVWEGHWAIDVAPAAEDAAQAQGDGWMYAAAVGATGQDGAWEHAAGAGATFRRRWWVRKYLAGGLSPGLQRRAVEDDAGLNATLEAVQVLSPGQVLSSDDASALAPRKHSVDGSYSRRRSSKQRDGDAWMVHVDSEGEDSDTCDPKHATPPGVGPSQLLAVGTPEWGRKSSASSGRRGSSWGIGAVGRLKKKMKSWSKSANNSPVTKSLSARDTTPPRGRSSPPHTGILGVPRVTSFGDSNVSDSSPSLRRQHSSEAARTGAGDQRGGSLQSMRSMESVEKPARANSSTVRSSPRSRLRGEGFGMGSDEGTPAAAVVDSPGERDILLCSTFTSPGTVPKEPGGHVDPEAEGSLPLPAESVSTTLLPPPAVLRAPAAADDDDGPPSPIASVRFSNYTARVVRECELNNVVVAAAVAALAAAGLEACPAHRPAAVAFSRLSGSPPALLSPSPRSMSPPPLRSARAVSSGGLLGSSPTRVALPPRAPSLSSPRLASHSAGGEAIAGLEGSLFASQRMRRESLPPPGALVRKSSGVRLTVNTDDADVACLFVVGAGGSSSLSADRLASAFKLQLASSVDLFASQIRNVDACVADDHSSIEARIAHGGARVLARLRAMRGESLRAGWTVDHVSACLAPQLEVLSGSAGHPCTPLPAPPPDTPCAGGAHPEGLPWVDGAFGCAASNIYFCAACLPQCPPSRGGGDSADGEQT